MQWIVIQIDVREHYTAPRAFGSVGMQESLRTGSRCQRGRSLLAALVLLNSTIVRTHPLKRITSDSCGLTTVRQGSKSVLEQCHET